MRPVLLHSSSRSSRPSPSRTPTPPLPLPEEGPGRGPKAHNRPPSRVDRKGHGPQSRPQERLRPLPTLAQARPRELYHGPRGADTPGAGDPRSLGHLHHWKVPARPSRRVLRTLPGLLSAGSGPGRLPPGNRQSRPEFSRGKQPGISRPRLLRLHALRSSASHAEIPPSPPPLRESMRAEKPRAQIPHDPRCGS